MASFTTLITASANFDKNNYVFKLLLCLCKISSTNTKIDSLAYTFSNKNLTSLALKMLNKMTWRIAYNILKKCILTKFVNLWPRQLKETMYYDVWKDVISL